MSIKIPHPADTIRWNWTEASVPEFQVQIPDRIRRHIIASAEVHNFVYHCIITMAVNRGKLLRRSSMTFPVPDHLLTALPKTLHLYIEGTTLSVYE